MSDYGWKAVVEYDYMTMASRLHLWRWHGGGIQEIVGFDESGWPQFAIRELGMISPFKGFSLHDDLPEVIAEAIKPGPSKAELQAYKDALDIERRRVDDMLQRVTPVT